MELSEAPPSSISSPGLGLSLWWETSPGAPVAAMYGSLGSRCHNTSAIYRTRAVPASGWSYVLPLLRLHYCLEPHPFRSQVRRWSPVSELSWSCFESCGEPQTDIPWFYGRSGHAWTLNTSVTAAASAPAPRSYDSSVFAWSQDLSSTTAVSASSPDQGSRGIP